MRILALIAATSTLVAGCGGRDSGPDVEPANEGQAAASQNVAAAAGPADKGAAPAWDLQSSGEGVALVLAGPDRPAIRLFCPAGGKRLVVNVPGFRAIGSEERLSFGSGGEAAALVADSGGDRQRGGVTGTGAVPADLPALIKGPISASYGAQSSGPHAGPPPGLSSAFVAACREGSAPAAAAAAEPAQPASGPVASAGPCMVQEGKPIRAPAVRALGTEPFWNARVEGRCVTYSHPQDQKGARVWTRFTPGPGGGAWSGSLGGRAFELRIRPQRNCSDGMSDRRYPLAAELVVGGERRDGCAEPL